MVAMSMLPPLLCALLVLAYSGCSSSVAQSTPSPLDYVELHTPDGWQLRVHGDGSGSLTHRQYPLHHLDYPGHTFQTASLFASAAQTAGRGRTDGYQGAALSSQGYQLSYYRARQDSLYRGRHLTGKVPQHAMHTAISRMQLAVDDASSERSCRMLRRAWLVAN